MQLQDIPGVGEKIKATLEAAGITTPEQLLAYYPRTHRYYHHRSIQASRAGEWVVLTAAIAKPTSHHKGRLSLQSALCHDATGSLTLRWFNSPYIVRTVTPNTRYHILGKVETYAGKKQLLSPTLKPVELEESTLPDPLILPIYTPLGTLKSGHFRNLIKATLDLLELSDPLQAEHLAKYHLPPLKESLRNLHFPDNVAGLNRAIHRLGFDELTRLQTESLILKESMSPPTPPLPGNKPLLADWLANLPFTLTPSQHSAITAVTADLSLPRAMHRLISGDVGSGKTLVAAAGALWALASGKKVLVLAPTQILAEQLHASFQSYLSPHVTPTLYTRTQKGDTSASLVVGTHALLSNKLSFDSVGLVIIDEQHRFGVKDRESLRRLSPTPHLLMLSATPIPRTLAMTALSHLDVTPMPDLPQNRLPVKTYVVPTSKRDSAYTWLKNELETNHQQAFIVTPLIEQAENEEESPKTALTSLERELSTRFPNLRISYVHGKMKASEKTARLESFRKHEADILVATSMIEVGIDIPHANLMLIENAELFGLATLHQLRGRVGRGGGQGHCFLLTSKSDAKTTERLGLFVREQSGAKLAEYDLSQRGPGDIFGTLQSGALSLRFADLGDPELLKATRELAVTLAQSGVTSYNTPI